MRSRKGWGTDEDGTPLPSSLLVSFWDIALDNFPEGNFCHRKLQTSEAAQLINAVKTNGTVHFGTDHDLAAPYKKRELDNTKELIHVLSDLGVNIRIDDFFSKVEDGVSNAIPITIFDIQHDRPMIVVTCKYSVDRSSQADVMGFAIKPDSVEFNLFEIIT